MWEIEWECGENSDIRGTIQNPLHATPIQPQVIHRRSSLQEHQQ